MLSKNTKKLIMRAAVSTVVGLSAVGISQTFNPPEIVQAATVQNVSGTVTVKAKSLWSYSRADWNAKSRVYGAGTKLNVTGEITVAGRKMYKLDNGYITANTAYITFSPNANSIPSAGSGSAEESRTGSTTSSLHLRSGRGTGHGSVGIIPKGATVTVLDTSDYWYKVSYNGKVGYSSSKYLNVKDTIALPGTSNPKPAPSTPSVTNKVAETTANLNLRRGVGTSFGILKTMPKGSRVEILQETNGWAKINHNGTIGYASMSYLKQIAQPAPTPTPTPVPPVTSTPEAETKSGVTTANLHMRQGATTGNRSVMIIPMGKTVKILGETNGWYKVEYMGKVGYSSGKYIKLNEVAKPTPTPEPTPTPTPTPTPEPTPEPVPEVEEAPIPAAIPTIESTTLNSGEVVSGTTLQVSGKVTEVQAVKSFNYYVNGVVQGAVSVSGADFSLSINNSLFNKDMNSVKFEIKNTDDVMSEYSYIIKGTSASGYAYSTPVKTLNEYVSIESGRSSVVGLNPENRFNDAKKYMDPANYVFHDTYKYMFMDLTYEEGELSVTAEDLNIVLAGRGVLEGTGESFLASANKYKVNPFYLVAHSLLETGNGSSVLARGQNLTEIHTKFGNLTSETIPLSEEEQAKTVYNVFGIGAYDGNANLWGAQKAYAEGWFTVEEAIDGGAEWISHFYINRANNKQNTLYKMRFNYGENMGHQYATDIGWAYKQTSRIKLQFDNMGVDVPIKFDIPLYRN